jgi:hypothetical protein
MKPRSRNTAFLASLICLAACERSLPTDPTIDPVFSAASHTEVALQADLNRSSVVSVSCDQGVCDIDFEGSGAANLMGPITYTAHVVQDFTTAPCNDTLTELTLYGATGSITLADVGRVCPSPTPSGAPNFISGVWGVAGGTEAFVGISGSGLSRGKVGAGVHLSGTVTY